MMMATMGKSRPATGGRRALVRAVLAGIVLGLSWIPLPADSIDDDGIGGTGVQAPAGDGIGGTGRERLGSGEPLPRRDGIGGTGVVGVITALGSIYVNDLHVQIAPGARVRRNGQLIAAAQHAEILALGQLVEFVAVPTPTGFETNAVHAIDAVVGPVEHYDLATSELRVLGQTIKGVRTHFAPGQWVRVSGLRDGAGDIHATRARATAAQPRVFVAGVGMPASAKTFRVGGIVIPKARATNVVGQRVWLSAPAGLGESGPPIQRPTVAFRVELRAPMPFASSFETVRIQAYPSANARTLLGFPVDLPETGVGRRTHPITVNAKVVGSRVRTLDIRPSTPLRTPSLGLPPIRTVPIDGNRESGRGEPTTLPNRPLLAPTLRALPPLNERLYDKPRPRAPVLIQRRLERPEPAPAPVTPRPQAPVLIQRRLERPEPATAPVTVHQVPTRPAS